MLLLGNKTEPRCTEKLLYSPQHLKRLMLSDSVSVFLCPCFTKVIL